MARVVVTDDSGDRILMDEEVRKVHLENRHSSLQVIERLVWAVEDAEGELELGPVSRTPRTRRLQAA